jgi:hypothetical protein
MCRIGRTIIAATLCAALLASVQGTPGGRDDALVGFLSSDKVMSLAAETDRAFASYAPRPDPVATLRSLVDPIHVMVFFAAWRQEDLKLAASVHRILETAGNSALTADYVGVSRDLTRPAGLLRDNRIRDVPEIVIYLQGLEGGRIGARPGRPLEEELAETIQFARWQLAEDMILDYDYFKFTFHEDLPIDCTRCHLAVRPVRRPARPH